MGLRSQRPYFMRWWLILAALAPAAGMLVTQAAVMLVLRPLRGWWVAGPLFVYFAYVAAFFVIVRRWVTRLRKQVADANFRVCFRCGYDLSTIAEDGVCPECGIGKA